MKYLLLLLFAFIDTYGQGTWVLQRSSRDEKYNKTFFVNVSTGWIVGDNGIILKTTNGGQTWFYQVSGTFNDLNDVNFLDVNNGLIAGDQKILKTTNGGNNWIAIDSTINFRAIFMITSSKACAVGLNSYYGVIYTSSDGGYIWTQRRELLWDNYEDVVFTDSSTGWVAGWSVSSNTNQVLKSIDGGISWIINLNTPLGPYCVNTSIGFDQFNTGVVTAKDSIRLTTDAGLNWLSKSTPESDYWKQVGLADSQKWCISGLNGKILMTSNGGENWVLQNIPVTNPNFWGVHFTDPDNCTVVGWEASTSGNYGTVLKWTRDPVPVELNSFTVNIAKNNAILLWTTASEKNNYGFLIERSKESGIWEEIAFVLGMGTTTNQISYSYTDKKLADGKYFYRLKQLDLNGQITMSDIVQILIQSSGEYKISQNYPNPFNPSTTITYQLPEKIFVQLKVYDILGNMISELVNKEQEKGLYEVIFLADQISSGIYYYTITAGKYIETRKMILLR